MTVTERHALEALRDPVSNDSVNEPTDDDHETDGYGAMVLDGTEQLDVSHAGGGVWTPYSGEFQELTSELLGEFWKSTSQEVRVKCPDYRTFRDRSAKQTATFSVQLDVMMEAYMAWSLNQGGAGGKGFFDSDERRTREEQQGKCDGMDIKLLSVLVLDVFCNTHGTAGAEKTSITVGPTDRYLSSALVCHSLIPCSPITPKVAITVSALNLYHTARQCCPHLLIQAYVKSLCDMHGVPFYNHRSHQFSIALDVYLQILALVSNLVHQALQRDQPDWWLKHCSMRFKMLFAQDGNDSLKRVATRVLDGNLNDTNQLATSLPTLEHAFHHEQYLTRKFTGHSIIDKHGDGNLCTEHWKNMKDSVTQKMWNIFDETGAFIAVCRHSFCLVIADMVQSGEQSKYALATTLASSILGECARSLNYTSLINAFHGHAHNRLCQLDNLTTYVEGLGLKDLEGCEHAFSKSNALAPSTHYVSTFHRRQAIVCYFEHNDEMEVYANLTKFLLNNYKQALDLLSNGHVTLEQLICELGVSDPTIFRQWLDEERAYLKSLLWEPAEETLQMEKNLETILSTWTVVTANNVASIQSDGRASRKVETIRRHAQENYKKDLKVLEDGEWQAAARLIANRKYQHALDNVERLVVSRIFELSKMNQSGTGYKLCKHIGKALQTHSAAIRAALSQYNAAAKPLGRRTLEFDEVVEYAFLADFDLLRDTWQDVLTCPWASPTARLAINTFFKLCRAEEEVTRLNVEIHRIVTYLIDEDRYLRACEALYRDTHPTLAHQISIYHGIRSHFTPSHFHSLEKISRLPGFSGTLTPGVSLSRGRGDSASAPNQDIDEDTEEDLGNDVTQAWEVLGDNDDKSPPM
ncbi:hypothetical protein BKA83DRAFT_4463979 [Pisolithus microcarpus]|nr:hypothetical protein BKA83DRAFT_4463979 [Pisolithus microcarpus]